MSSIEIFSYGHPGDQYGPFSDEEHDGGEDGLKYFNYGTLSADERRKRIIFAIRLLRPIVDSLRLLFTSVHNLLPFMQRRRLVRMVTNIVDIVNGFIFSSEFRDALKEFWTKNGFKAVCKKPVVKPSLKKFCEKVIDDATYLATCDLLKSSVGPNHSLASEINEVANQLTSISDQTKMKILETLEFDSVPQTSVSDGKSNDSATNDVAGYYMFPVDTSELDYPTYEDSNADVSITSDDGEALMGHMSVSNTQANGPTTTVTSGGNQVEDIMLLPQVHPACVVRRAVSDVFLQSPADRLYDWVTIMDSLDHAIKINGKSSKKQHRKEAAEDSKSIKSVDLEKDLPTTSDESFSTRLKVYQGCFDLIKQIKCGLVAISLGIRSGSTSSPSFINGIGGQLASKYKMVGGSSDSFKSGEKAGFVELSLVRDFLRLLEPKPNAANYLKSIPCFSFQKRTEPELTALEKKWKSVKWKPVGTKQLASIPSIESILTRLAIII